MLGLTSLDNDAVQEFTRRWESMFNQGNYRAMAGHYAQDATLIATQQETVTGRPAIERFWQHACEHAETVQLKRTVHVEEVGSDGDLGYLRGTVVLAAGDRQAATTVRYLTLWKRQPDGAWRVAVDISSAGPHPA
jgi:uncharacterized protein (TIGR02246 family)